MSSQSELEASQRKLIAADASMKVARAEMAVAQSQLNQAELTVQQHRIIAPIDGIITSVDQKQGEYASAGVPAVILRAEPAEAEKARPDWDASSLGGSAKGSETGSNDDPDPQPGTSR